MIRPALQACRQRRLETAAIVFCVSLALLIPGALATGWAALDDFATTWLTDFEPIVYLRAEPESGAYASLARELEGWPEVAEARLRTPAEAYADLETRLGAERLAELAIRPNMLPTSIVLTPRTPVGGHVDLVASVSALEVRPLVHSVEVPGPMASRLLTLGGLVGVLVFVLMLVGAITSVVLTASYLKRLLVEEQAMNDALELFGASSSSLRHPTLARGVWLGFWAGLIASAVLIGGLFVASGVFAIHPGVQTPLVQAWPVATIPMFIGPALGLAAGAWTVSDRRRPTRLHSPLLLRWETT